VVSSRRGTGVVVVTIVTCTAVVVVRATTGLVALKRTGVVGVIGMKRRRRGSVMTEVQAIV